MSELIEYEGAVRETVDRAGFDDLGSVLLLGEDNPVSSSPVHQLYPRPAGCAGHRLFSLILGLKNEDDYMAIWRTNLCSPSWDAGAARRRAWTLMGPEVPWHAIIMLGRKVATVFDVTTARGHYDTLEPFTSGEIDTGGRMFRLISLPHPSGRCREWNDPRSALRARSLLRLHCPAIPWGGAIL